MLIDKIECDADLQTSHQEYLHHWGLQSGSGTPYKYTIWPYLRWWYFSGHLDLTRSIYSTGYYKLDMGLHTNTHFCLNYDGVILVDTYSSYSDLAP